MVLKLKICSALTSLATWGDSAPLCVDQGSIFGRDFKKLEGQNSDKVGYIGMACAANYMNSGRVIAT